jgi:hypothetical protein
MGIEGDDRHNQFSCIKSRLVNGKVWKLEGFVCISKIFTQPQNKTLERFVWVIDDYDLGWHMGKNEIDLLIGSFPCIYVLEKWKWIPNSLTIEKVKIHVIATNMAQVLLCLIFLNSSGLDGQETCQKLKSHLELTKGLC